MRYTSVLFFLLLSSCVNFLVAQSPYFWHEKERELRYTPEGNDFVIVNGKSKFTRALYGTNTAFRIETGDVPEFGLFMPNMGGNIKLGIIGEQGSLWLNDADSVKSVYRAGSRIYEIKDSFIKDGKIEITVLALSDEEGLIMRIRTDGLPAGFEMVCMYGGASNKRFSRNGDLGVDPPDVFSLSPEACRNNDFSISENSFKLHYGQNTKMPRSVMGVFPVRTELKTGSPFAVASPSEVWFSEASDSLPVLVAKFPIQTGKDFFISIQSENGEVLQYEDMNLCFEKAELKRKEIAGTIKIVTPDPFINPLGSVLSVAADGIWGDSWLHGAVGWRMPLSGWRAAYTGDVLGWHERARKHFDGYAASQISHIKPVIPHPSQDSSRNLARADKKWGTQMYSNGYVCRNPYDTSRMHHYDMNMCYIDELLWHFNWTGDMEYVQQMWPVMESHLAWEKRNFDPNNDGLYDAYASIWASDALYYNSGGVTHSSAYNYRANKMAAEIAVKIGKDPKPYALEAKKILNAINSQLWQEENGCWAEYKDFMGHKTVHPDAAVWTIYHALDSDISTPFQAYQATRYIDTRIPRIPVRAKGLEGNDFYTISTSNWLPYSWSINNVAFAEVANTSLAYWQAGRNDEAFNLFKSSLLDGMYLGSSPGNIGQISFYDAARGECYRDFGDPIGVYSRVLVQGVFGILPDLMNNRLVIRPGFPTDWDSASISTPDLDFEFIRNEFTDKYTVTSRFLKSTNLDLLIKAPTSEIETIYVNSEKYSWSAVDVVGLPVIKISCEPSLKNEISIEWKGEKIKESSYSRVGVPNQFWELESSHSIVKIYDPQKVLNNPKITDNRLQGNLSGAIGHRTFFVRCLSEQMLWWEPVSIEIREPLIVTYDPESENIRFTLKNNTDRDLKVKLVVNFEPKSIPGLLKLKPGESSAMIEVPASVSVFGTNRLSIIEKGETIYTTDIVNWNIKNQTPQYETVQINEYLNASVSDIFKQEYLSPRSPYTTLQIPKQGIGEWCHPKHTEEINDSGLRHAVDKNIFNTPFGIPFLSVGDTGKNNIAFTSLWDNFPAQTTIPLSGNASHLYLMMAGSTNHMQCHIVNGTVTILYTDGSSEKLNLINPETWLPIEQDLFIDGFAFQSKLPRPYRVILKSGKVSRNLEQDLKINADEVYGRTIDGGAGLILDLPLNKDKSLKSIQVETLANDVVIGLMSITLLR